MGKPTTTSPEAEVNSEITQVDVENLKLVFQAARKYLVNNGADADADRSQLVTSLNLESKIMSFISKHVKGSQNASPVEEERTEDS